MTACCALSVKNEFIFFFPVKLFVYKGTQAKHQQKYFLLCSFLTCKTGENKQDVTPLGKNSEGER